MMLNHHLEAETLSFVSGIWHEICFCRQVFALDDVARLGCFVSVL